MGRGSLSALLDGMPVGVVVGNGDGRVVVWNEAVEAFLLRTATCEVGALSLGEPLSCRPENQPGGEPAEHCSRCQLGLLLQQTFEGRASPRRVLEVEVGPAGGRVLRRFRAHGSLVSSDRETLAAVTVRDLDSVLADVRHSGTRGIARLTGDSRPMRDLKATILEVAESRASVVILGESGSGKELVARAIHEHSDRRDDLFVPVNCGALPEGLMEAELFGHTRGSFTGAVRDRRGRFQLAHRGTIFLDEVAELPPALQVKLLRVLQDGSFSRVGDEATTTVDVRVVAATNRDLVAQTRAGSFRNDLFYRLAVVPIHVPPLRARADDIPLLALRLVGHVAEESGRIAPEIDPETMELLIHYPWPGNVRELENALHFGVLKARGRSIRPGDLPAHVRTTATLAALPGRARTLTLEEIGKALESSGGNRSEAARLLGVSRATLYRHLARLSGS